VFHSLFYFINTFLTFLFLNFVVFIFILILLFSRSMFKIKKYKGNAEDYAKFINAFNIFKNKLLNIFLFM